MRRAPLSLLLVGLLAVASAAASSDFAASDPASAAVVEKRWPDSLESIGKRLAESPAELPQAEAAIDAALRSAAAFAAAEGDLGATAAKEESVRKFQAALDALGPERPRFLGSSGGLGEIARTVLGDAEFLAQLDALRKIGLEPPDDAGLRQASARALGTFYEGRFEDSRNGSDWNGSFANDGGRRRRIRTTAPPRALTPDGVFRVPAVSAETPLSLSLNLELREAALAALQAAVRAVVVPASALASAVDRLVIPVQRDVKLIAASRAAVEWLARSREPNAQGLLRSFLIAAGLSGAERRAALADSLARTSALMDVSTESHGDVCLQAKASVEDYARFLREHLGDFPAGTRFMNSELGIVATGPDVAAVEYEITPDGRLAPARVIAADGSVRERGAAAGTWTIRGKDGVTTGWSLDAGSFLSIADARTRADSVAAAARWLSDQGFKPGGQDGMTDSLSSLLQDVLGHPDAGARALRIYADRKKGILSLDSEFEKGGKQRVARAEPGAALALFERTAADPNDSSAPWRKTMEYRGAGERDLLTTKIVSNGESARRVLAGTTVETIPVAVHYVRDSTGRWERDGRTREFAEQSLAIHSSAGLIGGAGEVLAATGRGVTDLTGAAVAASLALDLFPDRALKRNGMVAELQGDWFARAKTDFADNAFLSAAGNYYAPGAYREFKEALHIDDGKYIQNVRKELTDQGHPLLGAVAGAGVDAADGMVPMAAGLGAINAISPLGLAGQVAATGVNGFWTEQAAWSAGVSVKDYVRARRRYNERDPASVENYYTAVEGLANQSVGVPMLALGLHESMVGEVNSRARVESNGETADPTRFETEKEIGPGRIDLERASIAEIGRQSIASQPEMLSDLPLRRLYEYSLARRDFVAARVRAIAQECGLRDPPDIASLIKGQEPTGTASGTFESFESGVREKVRRKEYPSLNRMTDMARGRVSLEDFEAVKKFTLQTLTTESISDISYPSGTSPEFVAELKRLVGEARVKEHKAANVNNARIHIDLLDSETDFVYELQVGTKYFNNLMQDPLVKVPEPLVRVFAKVDPYGIKGDRANLHLVYYDGVKALILKHPEISRLPEARLFVEQVTAASRDSGGVNGMKPVDVAMLTQSAENLLGALYQRDPKIFDDLGHEE